MVTATSYDEESARYYDAICDRAYDSMERKSHVHDNVAVLVAGGFKYTDDLSCTGPKIASMVLEVGCGTGVLANMIIGPNDGAMYYRGFDFSKQALQEYPASTHYPAVRYGDAYDPLSYGHVYNTFVAVGVFGCLDDLRILRFVKKGTRVIFTVPDYKSLSHLRIYPDAKSIRDYYNGILRMPISQDPLDDAITKIELSNEPRNEKAVFLCDAVKL